MRVMVLAMGGTILSGSPNPLDFKDYETGFITLEKLLESIPDTKQYAEVSCKQIKSIDSAEINPKDWLTLKKQVDFYLNNQNFDGIVILHGTNTLEETAYFLNLTVDSQKPIVIVGSQRPPSAFGNDARINLFNAIRLAASPSALDKGVMVMLNDEINSARDVTKTNTYRLETFQSGQLGLLGYVDVDNTIQFYRVPARKHTSHSIFSTIPINRLPEVGIVYSYAGSSGNLIKMIIDSGTYQGIVVAGTGAGILTKGELASLKRAKNEGLFVARSSRVGNGRFVTLMQYEGLGFIAADNLSPQKARVLLMLALNVSQDVDVIQQIFTEY